MRKLTCPPEFLWALEAATWSVGPYSTPRMIEELNFSVSFSPGSVTHIPYLLASKSFNHLALKCLRIQSPAAESFNTLMAFPFEFPNLVHFSLTCSLHNLNTGLGEMISQDQWVQLLSQFPNLEVFNGDGIWGNEFDHIPEASDPEVIRVVQMFARQCPKLRQILCPVVIEFPGGAISHQNQVLRIWREAARSHSDSGTIVKQDDDQEDWQIRCELSKVAPT
ncbi:hypothetical protein BDN72DRAFT_859716 [Pluteus cervinus]|uniref:Uncharacterized protein n=1 Tax=Pluteus cervinus TaxID=181527 RepID=A0ACD3AP40_9AGAR|nr:hypothetical protein BDN72DRAFT_859716 [Pluteus cervinus]